MAFIRGHNNISILAGGEKELYELWNNDYKKAQWWLVFYSIISILLFSVGLYIWFATDSNVHNKYYMASAFYFSAIFAIAHVKAFVDASNTNYLMHNWDLQNAIAEFRIREEK